MQVLGTSVIDSKRIEISGKKLVIVHEIGLTAVPTATEFVRYISVKYRMSESGVWYMLKALKRVGVVDFTEKGEAQRPLSLTDAGMRMVRGPQQNNRMQNLRSGTGSFAIMHSR